MLFGAKLHLIFLLIINSLFYLSYLEIQFYPLVNVVRPLVMYLPLSFDISSFCDYAVCADLDTFLTLDETPRRMPCTLLALWPFFGEGERRKGF